ncbi:MAG: hypothetical protein U5M53_03010 [Rhodoferax sp.]|nr:hypothetical protein [Rhodoferax sp.]
MLLLVLLVMGFVVALAILPEAPQDFEPAFAQAAQGAGVIVSLFAFALVIRLGPRAFFAAAVGPQMHGGAQHDIARPAGMRALFSLPLKSSTGLTPAWQHRTRTTEHLANKAQMISRKYEFREFVPIVYANTSHLKLGDTYEAEVFAAAYYRGSDMKATVNGKEIPVKDGVAIYTVTPTSVGKKKALVKMYITNPLTKETRSYHQDFEYEVVDCK